MREQTFDRIPQPTDRPILPLLRLHANVHRGWCYKPDAATPEQRDLWDHVLLMGEFMILFVLTTLQYR